MHIQTQNNKQHIQTLHLYTDTQTTTNKQHNIYTRTETTHNETTDNKRNTHNIICIYANKYSKPHKPYYTDAKTNTTTTNT